MQHTITHNDVKIGTVQDFTAGQGRVQWFARHPNGTATGPNRDTQEEAEDDLRTWAAGGTPAYREVFYGKKPFERTPFPCRIHSRPCTIPCGHCTEENTRQVA